MTFSLGWKLSLSFHLVRVGQLTPKATQPWLRDLKWKNKGWRSRLLDWSMNSTLRSYLMENLSNQSVYLRNSKQSICWKLLLCSSMHLKYVTVWSEINRCLKWPRIVQRWSGKTMPSKLTTAWALPMPKERFVESAVKCALIWRPESKEWRNLRKC